MHLIPFAIFQKWQKKPWYLRGISIWECMILIYPVCEVATKDQDIHHRHPLEWDDNAILLNFLLHTWNRFWMEKKLHSGILRQSKIKHVIISSIKWQKFSNFAYLVISFVLLQFRQNPILNYFLNWCQSDFAQIVNK